MDLLVIKFLIFYLYETLQIKNHEKDSIVLFKRLNYKRYPNLMIINFLFYEIQVILK